MWTVAEIEKIDGISEMTVTALTVITVKFANVSLHTLQTK